MPRRPHRGSCAAEDMALEAVRRATRLTERLLAFARQQPLEPKAFNANRLVGAVCELLRRTVGETIALETVLVGRPLGNTGGYQSA